MARFRLAAGAVAVLALASACGGGSDAGSGAESDDGFADGSAKDIVAAAKADMSTLKSVHFEGEIVNQGENISLDLDVNTDGECQGSFGLAEGMADIVALDGKTWFKPDEAFWRASSPDTAEQIIAAVGDKWVDLGAEDDTFDSFCDLDELLDEMFTVDEDDGEYAKDGTQDTAGTPTVKLTRDDSDGGTVSGFVAVTGKHYLIQLAREGEDSGAVTFSKFDEELDITQPAAADIVDINALG